MFLTFVTFLIVTATFVGVIWFAVYRVATHLRGNDEGVKAVMQHVVLPLFGKKPEVVEPEAIVLEPPGQKKGRGVA